MPFLHTTEAGYFLYFFYYSSKYMRMKIKFHRSVIGISWASNFNYTGMKTETLFSFLLTAYESTQ